MSEAKHDTPKVPEDVAAAGQAQAMATGAYVRLRAVQEEDLAELAALLAETPCPRELLPWTTQRLRKKFNAEKDPGLWGKKERIYVAVRIADGQVVGYIDECVRGVCREPRLHIAARAADRNELGNDMLATYMQSLLDWHDQVRVEAYLLACEEQKQQWLTAAGFELEASLSDMYMHQGKPEALQIWGWVNPRLENGAGS